LSQDIYQAEMIDFYGRKGEFEEFFGFGRKALAFDLNTHTAPHEGTYPPSGAPAEEAAPA